MECSYDMSPSNPEVSIEKSGKRTGAEAGLLEYSHEHYNGKVFKTGHCKDLGKGLIEKPALQRSLLL